MDTKSLEAKEVGDSCGVDDDDGEGRLVMEGYEW